MNKSSRPVFVVLTTILILLVALISCEGKLNVSHTNAVRFSTEIGRKATANSEWQTDDDVGIYMLEHGTGTAATAAPERANRHYTADTASQTSGFSPADSANTLKWNDIAANANDTFDFISYYPWAYLAHTEDGAGTTSFYDTDTLYIDINRDRGTHEQDTGKADVLWGRTDNVQNNTSTVHLKLDHMLSRLIVNISPSTTVDATAINDATGGFTATVTGLNTQTAINLNDGTLDAASVIDAIVMKDISDTLTQSERNEGKRRFEAVLIPVGNTDALANVSLEFTLSGGAKAGTYTWKPSTTGAVAEGDKHLIHFDKGKQHVYNMTLNTDDNEVAVAAIQIEIKDWDTGDGVNAAATKAYSLTFGANEATGGSAPGRMYAHEGSLVTLPAPGTLEKDFYYFYGWNTLPNGNGTQYAAGESFTMPANDVTLYARWLAKVKSVSAGNNFTMILAEDGTLWATGTNYYGQLGDDTTIDKSTPVQVMTDVETVSAGYYHTMIVKKDGTLWGTGYNYKGELGVGGSLTNRTTPEQVTVMGTTVGDVFAGDHHTLILVTDGELLATGDNQYGQLGQGYSGPGSFLPSPNVVWNSTNGSVYMTDVTAVSAGAYHTMIKNDGKLWAVGRNEWGQLGDDTTNDTNIPVEVPSMNTDPGNPVEAVSAGSMYTMFLKKDGTLWATGQNNNGQLGDGTTTAKSTPVEVWDSTDGDVKMTNVKAVSAGASHTMILKKDGTLWATGNNGSGQLGVGATLLPETKTLTPVQVTSMGSDVEAVYAGTYHTLILKKDGTLWATGYNEFGQLGLGDSIPGTNRSTPVQVVF
ncbi:fimbrillin family protein [Parasphaerochaeta coccoides]|uniref:Listeria/Bacterioides repeat-containing protein n=1 Tax=Parasphaerochaeta coccoides (strain ATCC BAA-1237 / DSM 17374 / SPN1) TaxID=760011 RepID=F4GM17_PARC1|nr:fimbrillin family protein [Parasphaerochaeta coccoides]AEC02492.1 Listeria/Bacterioides repeat-containing protein [Parasphaerochaeta coccoides DSM 17374]